MSPPANNPPLTTIAVAHTSSIRIPPLARPGDAPFAGLEPSAKLVEHASRRLQIAAGEPSREVVDPHRLLGVDGVVRGAASFGHANEWRPPVILVRRKLQESVANKAVHRGMHALSRKTHPACDLRDGERPIRQGNRPEDLPTCGGEPPARGENVSGF